MRKDRRRCSTMSCRRCWRFWSSTRVLSSSADFNVHVHDADDPDARRLAHLASFDLIQHVSGPTQCCGNTLDLVITPAPCQLDSVTVDPAGILSDHSLVICRLPVAVERASVFEQQARGWRRVDARIYVAYWKRANCASRYPPMLTLIIFSTRTIPY